MASRVVDAFQAEEAVEAARRAVADGVAEAIGRTAAEAGANVIALSNYGSSGRKESGLGSVARAMLSKSPVPVLLLPIR